MSKTHHLDLLNNSISYFREAVSYAQRDSDDTNHWKFAILHVVQAMELAFKEHLRRVHPAFIYESVDRPGKTLTLRGALERLKNPQIGNIPIAEAEAAKIVKAFDLRSELTHFEFNHSHDHIELKFAEIFSFMIFFYRSYLGLATADFIDEDQHNKVIRLVRTRAELLERAKAYVGGRDDGDVWLCPSCQEATFLTAEEQCCFCHHKEQVVECPTCGEETLESELIDTSDLLHWDYDEGRMVLIENFGLEERACSECITETRQKVEDLRRAQYDEDLAMDEYYARKGR
ncbi:hypothetical protein [Mesorhizobium xinjiangense]|uniref:hypothetical protein n=1 Tax=Mesorhizobium xinjiangense TaxID=2678685 RepID=UPI0012EE9B37|nr:hypothetical protein [Mesorhizobium xinjiangense]